MARHLPRRTCPSVPVVLPAVLPVVLPVLLPVLLTTLLAGALAIGPAGTTSAAAAPIVAHVADKLPHQASKKPAPWAPEDSTVFNYPLSPKASDRNRIRSTIISAIKQTPPGAQIRITTFTFIDGTATRALVRAHRRGVSVQMLVNAKNSGLGSYRSLKAGLRQRRKRTAPPAERSFVKVCRASCRGKFGNLHAKLYLFSQVGATPWVSMISSANLTTFAADGQWNHLDTLVGPEEYQPLLGVFAQMKVDTPGPFLELDMPKAMAWVFPRVGTRPAQDPLYQAFRHMDCRTKLPDGTVARSTIRIGMYAWFDDRGTWLAKAVRARWEAGCDVKIIDAVMSGPVHAILEDLHGRGRIPMRRSVTLRGGEVADYNHSKYVAFEGPYGGVPSQLVWTGSMNFTQLGLRSDDIVVRLFGPRVLGAYLANFSRVWNSPSSIRQRPLTSTEKSLLAKARPKRKHA